VSSNWQKLELEGKTRPTRAILIEVTGIHLRYPVKTIRASTRVGPRLQTRITQITVPTLWWKPGSVRLRCALFSFVKSWSNTSPRLTQAPETSRNYQLELARDRPANSGRADTPFRACGVDGRISSAKKAFWSRASTSMAAWISLKSKSSSPQLPLPSG
jgi:hypothetical protein